MVLLAIAAAIAAGSAAFWTRSAGDPQPLLDEGLAAVNRGDFPTAIDRLDAVLRLEPEHSQALLYRGQVAYDQGRLHEAREFFSRVPDEPARFGSAARYAEGLVAVELGRAGDGVQRLQRAAELNPQMVQAHERLLELYVAQMRPDEIRRELDAIRRLRPWRLEELVLYSSANQRALTPEEGIRQMKRFVEAAPDDAASRRQLARYLMDDEQFPAAEEVLGKLLTRDPADAQAAGLLAEAKLLQDEPEGALAALARINSGTSPDELYYRSAGRLWLRMNEWQLAAACLAEAARLDPQDLTTAHQLGVALSRAGSERALEQLQRAERLDHVLKQASRLPNRDQRKIGPMTEIIVDVGSTLLELERYREAAYWFDYALMLSPGQAAAQRGLDQATQRLSQQESAARLETTPATEASSHLSWTALIDRIQREAASVQIERGVAAGSASAIRLRDVHAAAGIDFQYFNGDTGLKYLLESMGGGVAVIDYDADGWPDLYLVQGCHFPYDPTNWTHRDRLYRNLGNGQFEDVTLAAGLGDNRYGQGCAVGDYDNDGYPDLLVANYGRNTFYRNNGDGTFSDWTAQAGLGDERWSSSAGFADFDQDGALDLYVSNYVDSLRVCRDANGRVAACDPANFNGEQDRLYRNRGDGSFEDVTESSGIVASDGKGLGVVLADLDNDSWVDIYVANDGTPNFLFHNRSSSGRLEFKEIGKLAGVAVNGDGQAEGGMGIACADFDHDGRLDLYVTNFIDETNTHYRNLGNMLFEDATRRTGTAAASRPMVGFGVQAIDFDWDGHADLVVANGHIDDFRFRQEPWKMPSQLFRNVGEGRFEDVSATAGPYFSGEYLGRGAARLDFDRDGAEDVVIVHQDAPLALLRNETLRQGNWIAFRLRGMDSTREAIGGRIEVQTAAGPRVLTVAAGDGFYASNERVCRLGLGALDRVEQVVVTWPGGRVERLDNPAINKQHILTEGRIAGPHP